MLTMNYTTHDRETVNEARNAYRAALSALETAYRETIDGTPKETLEAACSAVSAEMVFAVLATIVYDCQWDGRISFRSARWAETVAGALDKKTAALFHIYTNIHRAHLDQLAVAAMDYAKIG